MRFFDFLTYSRHNVIRHINTTVTIQLTMTNSKVRNTGFEGQQGVVGGWGKRGESDDLDKQQISLLVKLIQSLNSHQLKYQRQ